MYQLKYQPYPFKRTSDPSTSKLPFSLHSLVNPKNNLERAQIDEGNSQKSSGGNDGSTKEEEATDFIQELWSALPDRLSKRVRGMKHHVGIEIGVPIVYTGDLRKFLMNIHGLVDSRVEEMEVTTRVFLKLVDSQGHEVYYVELKEETSLNGMDNFTQLVSLLRYSWAFPEDLSQRSHIFDIQVIPEWMIPTIKRVTMECLNGDKQFMPSSQYLASYFRGIVLYEKEKYSVDVPTLDGQNATVKLTVSGVGQVRNSTMFLEAAPLPGPFLGLEFVEGWFGLPGLRLMNYFKNLKEQDVRVRIGILSGSSGIGKSMIISRLVSHFGVPCHTAHPASFSLTEDFSYAALTKEPSVIILDAAHELSVDVVALQSQLNKHLNLLVIMVTSQPSKLPAGIMSKADFHIELDHPTFIQRTRILKDMISQSMPAISLQDTFFSKLAEACPGFLIADLHTLVKAGLAKSYPTLDNFLASKKLVHQACYLPQAQKIPPVFFNEIGGLERVKTVLKRLAYRCPTANIPTGKGALLYGPPGTGKTLLGKAMATEAAANFLPVRIPDLIRGEIGASEKALSRLFAQSRASSPCILFLDELDALFVNRASSSSTHGSRLVAQFVLELDGLDDSVIVLATTNHPLAIDRSVLRPGRIDHHLYLPPPEPRERLDIFKLLFPHLATDKSLLEKLPALTQGFTGADLSALKHRAQVLAYNQTSITSDHVLAALDPTIPCPLVASVSSTQLEEFYAFQNPC